MSTLPHPRLAALMTAAAVITAPSVVLAQTSSAPPKPPTTAAPAPTTPAPGAPTTAPAAPVNPDRALIATLTTADRDQVLMARAALPTLQDAELKRYAQKMIDDHTAHLNATSAIATRLVIPPEAETTPGGQAAATTDAAYVAAMVTEHQQLLSQLPADGNTIQDSALRQLLTDTRTAVRTHLDEATRIKTRLAGRAP